MITLDAYAQHVYQHASPATSEHLRRTVWEPLGLVAASESNTHRNLVHSFAAPSSHAALYAVPPITTNLRCVGLDITEQLHRLVDQASVRHSCSNEHDAASEASAADTTSRYRPPFTLDPLGLPFCACVQPGVQRLTEWPPSCPSPALAPSSPTSTSATDPSQVPLVIVVDAGAAEAVLRGSDLYAPGIVTASRVFAAGEEALVAFYAERAAIDDDAGGAPSQQPQQQPHGASSKGNNTPHWQKKLKTEAGETGHDALPTSDVCPTQWRIVSALTAGITLPPAQYAPLDVHDATTAAALLQRSSFLVCIASGTLFMGWKDVLGRRARGVALRTDWTPQLQPSRNVLRRLLNITRGTCSPTSEKEETSTAKAAEDAAPEEPCDAFFLQNYSSMVPVSLLVEHIAREIFSASCRVLDACAAPGGKTSLLLSLMQARAAREKTAGEHASVSPNFRVVCCERSRPRHGQLMHLLQQHFASPADTGADNGETFLGRVLESHCMDTNKYLKKILADGGDAVAASTQFESLFDAILLDPPCTGLGLRPKLLPHVHSVASIQQSADYQRKLFDSCVRHLRCTPTAPGVLVYSTCTTTLEENEANVLHFLRTYPSLRLARASTAAHRELCALSVTSAPSSALVGNVEARSDEEQQATGERTRATAPMLLLLDEIMALQRERERAVAVAAGAGTDANVADAPLLALRFMPRPLEQYDDPSEDSVGFFVAVFLCDRFGA